MNPPDRLPPHSGVAEAAALGCILLDPSGTFAEAQMIFPGKEVFYDLRHQTIYEAMLLLSKMGKPVDVATLHEVLAVSDKLDQVGGLGYVASLPDETPSADNFKFYAETVVECWRLRRMLCVLSESAAQILDRGSEPVEQLLDRIEARVLEAGELGQGVRGCVHIKEHVIAVGGLLDNYQRGVGLIGGIRTGFGYLDKMIGGLAPGQVIVIGARPSMGKTSWAMNLVDRIAIHQKLPCAVFSLEMGSQDLTLRLMCARSHANFHHVHSGFMSKEDYGSLAAAGADIAGAPIYIDDTPSLRITELRARARRAWSRFGVRLIVIDYLQLMSSDTVRGENREREVAQMSNGIKTLARELNVPVVVLAQLNREFDKEGNRKPRLSDLRDSGAIEQDADVVGLLYRERKPEEEEEGKDENIVHVNLLIAKQRNGPTGDVQFVFFRQEMRFEDRYAGKGNQQGDVTNSHDD
jgi:replicative DNA helicase